MRLKYSELKLISMAENYFVSTEHMITGDRSSNKLLRLNKDQA